MDNLNSTVVTTEAEYVRVAKMNTPDLNSTVVTTEELAKLKAEQAEMNLNSTVVTTEGRLIYEKIERPQRFKFYCSNN